MIELPTFYSDFGARSDGDKDFKSATRDVAKLLGELKTAGVQGVVVDLRNNGGGSLAEANALTGLFIDTGPARRMNADAEGRTATRHRRTGAADRPTAASSSSSWPIISHSLVVAM